MHTPFKQDYDTMPPVLCCKALSDSDYFNDCLTSIYGICNDYGETNSVFMQLCYNDDKQPQNKKRSFGPGSNLTT